MNKNMQEQEKEKLDNYLLPGVFFLGVSTVLIAAIIITIWLSTEQELQSDLANLLRVLFVGAWLLPLVALVLGLVHSIIKRKADIFVVWIFVFFGLGLITYKFYDILIDCDVSREVQNEMADTLSITELKSAKSHQFFCPTSYEYWNEKQKIQDCVFGVSDFIHGPKVYFGRG